MLLAAADAFPAFTAAQGYEISADYSQQLHEHVALRADASRFDIREQAYFLGNWRHWATDWAAPLLVIGNPPWVTNAYLSALGSSNQPTKANTQQQKGLDALTGKSNFDISEWMLLDMLTWLPGRDATLAMLVKTAVARKVLRHAWEKNLPVAGAAIYQIDAKQHFAAAVDACLLIVQFQVVPASNRKQCAVC